MRLSAVLIVVLLCTISTISAQNSQSEILTDSVAWAGNNEPDENDTIITDSSQISQFYYRGLYYKRNREFDKAYDDFSYCINMPGNDWTKDASCAQRAFLNVGMWELENALSDANHAIQLDPKSGYYCFIRGFVYSNMKKYDLALRDYQMALKLGDESYELYYNLGAVYGSLGDYANARKNIGNALKIDSNCAVCLDVLRQIKETEEKYFASKPKAQKSNSSSAYLSKAMALTGEGKYTEAIGYFNLCLNENPANDAAYFNRAILYEKMKRPDDAIADYGKYLKLRPEDNMGYYYRGTIYLKQKKYNDACADFRKADGLGNKQAAQYLKVTCANVK